MSRIGIKPLALPSGVTAEVQAGVVIVKGPKGELKFPLIAGVAVAVDAGIVQVTRADNSDEAKARHGLVRVLIRNMTVGVSQGFEKRLEIIGVGYKAQIKGKTVVLSLGHSHPIDFPIPVGIEMGQDEKNKNILIIRGIDKQLVGQTAAQIKELRAPEPYKGKGIRYLGENVRRKPGKAAVSKPAA